MPRIVSLGVVYELGCLIGSSGLRVGRRKVEATEMEQDNGFETLIVAVSVRSILQHLNFAVEPLSHRIADRLSNVRDDILEVSLERVGNGNELR